ncbi:Sterol 3-beta-glucosyltransferase UGT80B1 [Apiospora rasikravindrae]|uniref:Sterol 3-beta-glucosyltransferase UGT80B1 n=1 Tax=Apiospora rasikravindrae TaxID=990691 RepID=A0ABR1SLH8_9PEZI
MSVLDAKRAAAAARSSSERENGNNDNEGQQQDGSANKNGPEVAVSDGFPEAAIPRPEAGMPLPELPQLGAEDEVPPAYSEVHDQISLHQSGFDAGATLTDDGRIDININQTSRQLADIIAPTLREQLKQDARSEGPLPPAYIPPSLGGRPGQTPPPRLNIVIQIVGSRGDVQPFVALGQVLKNTYGHRVRIATHGTFQKFVEENGLEFFCIGGDPAELMAFMVKHPGLMPGFDAVASGEVTKRRKGIEQIVYGCWRSCIEAGNGFGPAPRLQRGRNVPGEGATTMVMDPANKPFVADAIIANPPSFAHIHVAEKLGIPLHLMFTMPWSPTRAFPQPLANIQSTNTDPVTTNYVSYALVEMMTWQGLGDVINRFRTKVLDLDPLSLIWAPGVLTRLRIPSPALIPKPNDWGNHIDIAGFFFLNLASNFTPEPELGAFLEAGPPPIYIGFGSIVVDDPNALTRMIFDAVAATGVRALVSKGWGGLGADSLGVPDNIYMLGNVPHDWLFQHVSAVCHHGGAGTTAAGINAGKPTIVVPFFGDQPFWGAMKLAEAIRVAMKPETQERAKELGEKIREEQGTDVGGQSFHQHLDVDNLRCSVAPSRVAVWRVRRTKIRLSSLAAACLVQHGYLQYSDLKLYRSKEYSTEDEPWDPVSAVTSALVGDLGAIGLAVADFPRDVFNVAKKGAQKMPGDPKEKTAEQTSANPSSSDRSVPVGSNNNLPDTLSSPQSPGPANESTSSLTHTASGASGASAVSTTTTGSSERPTAAQQAPAKPKPHPVATTTESDIDRVMGAGNSINNMVTAGVKTPMNFCLGLARGFRNAPKLYNDDTVRPTEKVTDLSSGIKVASKEFGLGLFDGISGLVTQPLRGAEKEGAAGLVKGFAKGIGGLLLKPAAGAWAIPAYTMAGLHAEIRSKFAQSAYNYIVASRISQGNLDYQNASHEERDDVEVRWLSLKDDLKGYYQLKQKEKGKSRDVAQAPEHATASTENLTQEEEPQTGWWHTRNLSFEERKRLQEQKKAWKQRQTGTAPFRQGSHATENLASSTGVSTAGGSEQDMEQAIQAAVRETSRGDAREDARIEQAIRQSVGALRSGSISSGSTTSGQSTAATSVTANSFPADVKQRTPFSPEDFGEITDEEYQAYIEQAVQASIAEQQRRTGHRQQHQDEDDEEYQRVLRESQKGRPATEEDDEELRKAIEASRVQDGSAGPHGDDEELKKAIAASQTDLHRPAGANADDEEALKRAIEESERAHQEELKRVEALKKEEDVVLEYIKKQSLAEEQYRKKGKDKVGSSANDNDDDDEELKKALEESLRQGGKAGESSGA